mmetsp:Transcript_137606/g.439670  ORF Transcript_137606/g.439670 Transcript_137606/m.439670 type:complete len:611 (-) Transcript_137606:880-2712(-)
MVIEDSVEVRHRDVGLDGQLPELRVLRGQQLLRRAELLADTSSHHQDLVRVQDRADAVRDAHDRGGLEHLADGALNQCIRLVVDRCRGLVEQDDLRAPQNSPREAEQLALADAEGGATLLDLSGEAVGQGLLGVHLHTPQSIHDGLVAVLFERIQVASEGCLSEEHRLLRDHRQLRAERVQANLLEILAVDEHRARLHLGEPQQRHDDAALAAAGAAHDAQLLPGADREGQTTQSRIELGPVAHRDVPVLDGTPGGPILPQVGIRRKLIRSLLRQVAIVQDALDGGELLLQVADGLGDGLDVLRHVQAVRQCHAHKGGLGVLEADTRQDGQQRASRRDDHTEELQAQGEPSRQLNLEKIARLVVVDLLVALHAQKLLVAEGAHRGQAGQGLRDPIEDRRRRDGHQALRISRSIPVMVDDDDVADAHGEDGDDNRGVDHDDAYQDREEALKATDGLAEQPRELVVQDVHVRRKTVQQPAAGRGVEEDHRRAEDREEHQVVELASRPDDAQGEDRVRPAVGRDALEHAKGHVDQDAIHSLEAQRVTLLGPVGQPQVREDRRHDFRQHAEQDHRHHTGSEACGGEELEGGPLDRALVGALRLHQGPLLLLALD